jgi:hypothetical protein
MGVGQFDFFIRDRVTKRDVFRSTRFRQTRLDDSQIEFLDLDTGEKVVCGSGVGGNNVPWPDGRMKNDEGMGRIEYPTTVHVEMRNLRPADFAYIVDPLTRIFRASVETGNPVRWC